MGAALQQGTQGFNTARQCLLAAGLPVTTAGMSVDRQCSSGLMAIATAAKTIVCDGVDIMVGGGLESISLVQNEHQNRHRAADPNVLKIKPEVYLPMIDTAEIVSKRYKISREAQDEYSLPEPDAHRRGAARGPARRRDRADEDDQGDRGQGHQGSHATKRSR